MSKLRFVTDYKEKNMIIGNHLEKYKLVYLGLMILISLFEGFLLIRGLVKYDISSERAVLYITSYSILLGVSLLTGIFLIISMHYKFSYSVYNIVLHIYSAAIIIWSIIISYLDIQYGTSPIVYLTVIVTISGIVVIEPQYLISLIIPSSIILIGLDSIDGFNYFKSSSEYINFYIFIIMAMIINVRHFIISVKEYKNKEILEASVLEERNRVSAISLQTIKSISNAVDAKDKYTREHSQRVAEYSRIIAESLKWEDSRINEIYEIALLHDIGKIGVPDSILNSTTKLSFEEFELMKQHTVIGGEILKDLTILKNVDLGAKYHHERWDGNGYPSKLKGTEIPIEARVIAVADAFDAMNSNRVYRNRLTKEKIISELIEGSGTQFDPEIIEVFLPHAKEIVNR